MANNWMDHSKRPTRRTEKILKNDTEIFWTCGFRGDFRESLNFHFKTSKVSIIGLDFRQNPLKVEKPLKMPVFGTVSLFLNDQDFSREIRPCNFSSIIVF